MEESNSLYIYVHCTVSQSKLLTFKKFNKISNMHKGRKLPFSSDHWKCGSRMGDLKWQCHEIFWPFFSMNPTHAPGPMINRLKRIFQLTHFSRFIRCPGGLDSCKKNANKSRDTATSLYVHNKNNQLVVMRLKWCSWWWGLCSVGTAGGHSSPEADPRWARVFPVARSPPGHPGSSPAKWDLWWILGFSGLLSMDCFV